MTPSETFYKNKSQLALNEHHLIFLGYLKSPLEDQHAAID